MFDSTSTSGSPHTKLNTTKDVHRRQKKNNLFSVAATTDYLFLLQNMSKVEQETGNVTHGSDFATFRMLICQHWVANQSDRNDVGSCQFNMISQQTSVRGRDVVCSPGAWSWLCFLIERPPCGTVLNMSVREKNLTLEWCWIPRRTWQTWMRTMTFSLQLMLLPVLPGPYKMAGWIQANCFALNEPL